MAFVLPQNAARLLLIAGLSFWPETSAQAQEVHVFTDRVAWERAVAQMEVHQFEGLAPQGGTVSLSSGLTIGQLTIQGANGRLIAADAGSDQRIAALGSGAVLLAPDGLGSFGVPLGAIRVTTPVQAIAFDYTAFSDDSLCGEVAPFSYFVGRPDGSYYLTDSILVPSAPEPEWSFFGLIVPSGLSFVEFDANCSSTVAIDNVRIALIRNLTDITCGRDRVRPVIQSPTGFLTLEVVDTLVACDESTGEVLVDLRVTSRWKAWYYVTVSGVPADTVSEHSFVLGPSGAKQLRVRLKRGGQVRLFADAAFAGAEYRLYAIFGLEFFYRTKYGSSLPSSLAGFILDDLLAMNTTLTSLIKLGKECLAERLFVGDLLFGTICVAEVTEEILDEPALVLTLTAYGVPITDFSGLASAKRLYKILEFLAAEYYAANEFTVDEVIVTGM